MFFLLRARLVKVLPHCRKRWPAGFGNTKAAQVLYLVTSERNLASNNNNMFANLLLSPQCDSVICDVCDNL